MITEEKAIEVLRKQIRKAEQVKAEDDSEYIAWQDNFLKTIERIAPDEVGDFDQAEARSPIFLGQVEYNNLATIKDRKETIRRYVSKTKYLIERIEDFGLEEVKDEIKKAGDTSINITNNQCVSIKSDLTQSDMELITGISDKLRQAKSKKSKVRILMEDLELLAPIIIKIFLAIASL